METVGQVTFTLVQGSPHAWRMFANGFRVADLAVEPWRTEEAGSYQAATLPRAAAAMALSDLKENIALELRGKLNGGYREIDVSEYTNFLVECRMVEGVYLELFDTETRESIAYRNQVVPTLVKKDSTVRALIVGGERYLAEWDEVPEEYRRDYDPRFRCQCEMNIVRSIEKGIERAYEGMVA